jgi:hypothetical protein
MFGDTFRSILPMFIGNTTFLFREDIRITISFFPPL